MLETMVTLEIMLSNFKLHTNYFLGKCCHILALKRSKGGSLCSIQERTRKTKHEWLGSKWEVKKQFRAWTHLGQNNLIGQFLSLSIIGRFFLLLKRTFLFNLCYHRYIETSHWWSIHFTFYLFIVHQMTLILCIKWQ